ncbi:MAG: cyclic nucleotide-binding/CBS domain-containing protein [Ramlibacter sp.]
MKVADLCTRDIVTVPASATVREAAVAMREHQVGALAVTDPYQPGRVIGVVTDRDLVLDLLAAGRPVDDVAIGGVCRTGLVGVPGTSTLQEAVHALQSAGVRRLLVMGPGDAVLGLISFDDLIGAVADELDALAGSLRTGRSLERARLHATGKAEPVNLYLTRNEP